MERYVPASELSDAPAEHTEPEANDAPEVAVDAPRIVAAMRPDTTRDGMLDQVLQIAETFRRNEPNSPFGYTLEEAVRRARLPWPDLLREMMPDPAPRSSIMAGFGLKPHAE